MTSKKKAEPVSRGVGAGKVVHQLLEEWGELQLAAKIRERILYYNELEGFDASWPEGDYEGESDAGN